MFPKLLDSYQDFIHTRHIELDITLLHSDSWRKIFRNPRFSDKVSLEKEALTTAIRRFPALQSIHVRLGAVFPNERSNIDKKTLKGIVAAGAETSVKIQGKYKDVSSYNDYTVTSIIH
jgi:hypothetical protein